MKQNQQFVQFKKDIFGYFDGTNKNTEIGLIFNSDNTEQLCNQFPALKIKDKKIKLRFGLPELRPPSMIPSVDETVVQSEFSLK